MNFTLEEYIQDIKSQLCCNQTKRVDYITYNYTEQEIDRNVDYFEKCINDNLSGYKALLFFGDYLENILQPQRDYTTD